MRWVGYNRCMFGHFEVTPSFKRGHKLSDPGGCFFLGVGSVVHLWYSTVIMHIILINRLDIALLLMS